MGEYSQMGHEDVQLIWRYQAFVYESNDPGPAGMGDNSAKPRFSRVKVGSRLRLSQPQLKTSQQCTVGLFALSLDSTADFCQVFSRGLAG